MLLSGVEPKTFRLLYSLDALPLSYRRLMGAKARLRCAYSASVVPSFCEYYSNSFNLNNVAELSRNRTRGSGVQVETENEKFTVMCSRSQQTLEFGHFTLLFGRVRRRNEPEFKTHVHFFLIKSYCFVTFSLPSP